MVPKVPVKSAVVIATGQEQAPLTGYVTHLLQQRLEL
jgi:hypothetical protein